MDKDGSGEIGFEEFLAILHPKVVATGGCAKSNKIFELQAVQKVKL